LKIIVAGDGKVGATLTRQLTAEGYDITLIDSNKDVLSSSMEQFDIMTVHGNCATKDTLLKAGITDTDLIIAATSADEVNLLCCITAHGLNKNLHTIARIRNPEYSSQIYDMRDMYALSMTVNPEKQASNAIEKLLRYPGFLKHDTFAKGRVDIVELRVKSDSKLCNIPLSALPAQTKCNVLVCAVIRNGEALAPNGDFVLQAGDRIFVTASVDNLSMLLKSLGMTPKKTKNILICGGGKISYYLAKRLEKSSVSVTLVEKDEKRCVELASLLPTTNIIHGDASDQNLLNSEGLADCEAVVTATGLDEMNMIISLYANNVGVPQTITKLSRIDSGSIPSNIPLGSIICPKELCCNSIVRYVRAIQNQSGAAIAVHFIADGQAQAIEFRVDEQTKHCGEALKDIKIRKNVLVVCITHNGKIEIPNGNSSFKKGDGIIIVTSSGDVVRQLNDIFI
jgi:trk system potassium uptake protein TrkA